jgi:hypothetical protein
MTLVNAIGSCQKLDVSELEKGDVKDNLSTPTPSQTPYPFLVDWEENDQDKPGYDLLSGCISVP